MDGHIERHAYTPSGEPGRYRSPAPGLSVDLQANIVTHGDRVSRVTPRVAELLHVLTAAYPGPVTVEAVITGIWGTERPRSAPTALRNAIGEARKAIAVLDWEIVRLHSWARPALMLKRSSALLLTPLASAAFTLANAGPGWTIFT
jgi:hypothetical protein